MALNTIIKTYIERLNREHLLRRRSVTDLLDASLIRFDSNDYLSLARDKRIIQAYEHGFNYYPVSSSASMVLSGYHENHQTVERAFAQLLQVDECILFSSGYAANTAVASLLGAVKAHCIIDKLVHASTYDGLRLSNVSYARFSHNNLTHLAQKLTAQPENSVVLTEGIFSMSGSMAPLSAINQLCHVKHNPMIVDEAHSFGVIGEQGKGAVDLHYLTQYEVPLRIIPLGKAYAAQGAVVAGQKDWICALLQAGRSLIYSTAVSPALSYGLLKTLDVVVAVDERRLKLKQLIDYFKKQSTFSPLQWSTSNTAIQQLRLGSPKLALHYAQELKKNGICCSAIRPPTVHSTATGLRIILNYCHTDKQINQLFNALHLIYEHTFS